MLPDPDRTRSDWSADPTADFDLTWEAGLAAAFALEPTPAGWPQPPYLVHDSVEPDPPDHRSDPPDTPKAGAGLQLLGEIARGGMGVILRGRDPGLGRDLAVKVLKAEFAERATAVARFVEEARVSGRLQHPGVVPVYELGRLADGRPYFTMKLVRGRTLASLLAGRASKETDRGRYLKIFEQVCQTVAYAHSTGVIHRDLKPSNVMVGDFGEVQVMDWGLAKVIPRGGSADGPGVAGVSREPQALETVDDGSVIRTARGGSTGSETLEGSVMGTPAYMSPEQAAGEIDKLDERTDVFGLGSILCVILTGKPPYTGNDGESVRRLAVRAQLSDVFARLDECECETELAALCKRCLAPRREDRPRTAGEVAEEIHTYLVMLEDRAQRAEVERAKSEAKAAEERRRRRVTLALAGCVLGLVVLAGVGAWWVHEQRARTAADLASRRYEARQAVTAALIESHRALAEGRWVDAGATITLAQNRLGSGGDTHPDLRTALEQTRSDRELGVALERAKSAPLDGSFESPHHGPGDPQFAARQAALRKHGFVAWEMSEGELRRRLESSHIGWYLTGELSSLARYRISPSRMAYPELFATMMRLDNDPFRRRLSDARLRRDTEVVLKLAEEPALLAQPASTLTLVADSLREGDQPVSPAALANLRLAREANPADFELHLALSTLLVLKGQRDDRSQALGYSQVAVAVRPQSSLARSQLGFVRARSGDLVGAEAAYRDAVRLDSDNAVAHASLGSILLTKRDLRGAEESIRSALRLDPGYAYAHANLGAVLFKRGERVAAEESIREALRLNPNYAYAYANLSAVLLRSGDKVGAEAAVRRALQLDPTSARVHNVLGSVLLSQDRTDEAEAVIREALRLDPSYAPAHVSQGNLLRERNDTAGAEAAYREAIRLDAKDETAYLNLGILYSSNGKARDARAMFEEAVRINPANAVAQYKLGTLLLAQQEQDAAEEALRNAVRLDPNHARAHTNLGYILSKRGDLSGAEAAYRNALRVGPKEALTVSNLGAVLMKKDDLAGAEEAYREAVRIDPGFAAARINLGLVLARRGDLDGAATAYREVLRRDPGNVRAHTELAKTLFTLGDMPGAEAAYREVLRLNPKSTNTYNLLGRVLERKEDWAGAATAYREAIRITPNLAFAIPHVVLVLLRQDDASGAIEALRAAVRLDPKSPQSHVALGRALEKAARPAEGFRVLTDALGRNPDWGADTRNGLRYTAARLALMCSEGRGIDIPASVDRPSYRRRAFEHLSGDLEATRKLAPADRAWVYQRMSHWLADADLASVRNRDAVEKLPIDERVVWVKLWTAVRELRDSTAPREQAPPPRPAR